MTTKVRFSLSTVIEAVELFTYSTQAEVNNIILRLSLEDHIPTSLNLSKENKANRIIEFAKKNPEHETAVGSSLVDEIVERAAKLFVKSSRSTCSENPHHVAYLRALHRDGFMLTEEGMAHKTLPDEPDLPLAESELYSLLDECNLTTVKGHLEQAISNHSQGNWAAANSQLRTCLEG
jgi:hypothetical protein